MSAANNQRGEVEIRLGGKSRLLRFRTSAIRAVEEKLNMSLQTMLDPESIGIRHLVWMIWAGHLEQEPRLTPQKVERWLDDDDVDLTDLIAKVYEAFIMGMPGGKKLLEEAEAEKSEADEAKGEQGENPTSTDEQAE